MLVWQQCRVTAGLERWAYSALSMATWRSTASKFLLRCGVRNGCWNGLEQPRHLDATLLIQHFWSTDTFSTSQGRCVGNCSQCFHVRHWETPSCRVPRSVVMREKIGGQNGFFNYLKPGKRKKNTILNPTYSLLFVAYGYPAVVTLCDTARLNSRWYLTSFGTLLLNKESWVRAAKGRQEQEMFLVIKCSTWVERLRKALCRNPDHLIKLHQHIKHAVQQTAQRTVQYLMGYRQVQPNTLAAVQMARSQVAGFHRIDHSNFIAAKMVRVL